MGLSLAFGQTTDALIVLAVILGSALLGFWQEYRASNAVARLLDRVRTTATVIRDGTAAVLGPEEVVPGDLVELSAGAAIPADGRILASTDLFVDESALNGESYPAEKAAGDGPAEAAAEASAARTNALFAGSHVISGTSRMLVARTGRETTYGDIAARLRERAPPNYLVLSSLKQARYSAINVGHFGHASESYTHFTSPIRRYPDLVVHRVLREILTKRVISDQRKKALEALVPDIAFSSSRRERLADDAENAVIRALRAWFMKDKVGDSFEGKVVGISPMA